VDGTRGAFPPPDDITFLDRNGIRITGCWFAVPGRRYAVRDLNEIWTVAGPRNPLAMNATKVACLVLVVAGITAPYLDSLAAWLGVGVILAIPVTVALVALRTRPRPMALFARYHGRTEQLLESANPTWFHQVCRALNRALEFNGRGA
jgi:hypothetical protein